MQSTILYICLLLASIAVFSGHAFTSQSVNTRTTSSALFSKRKKLKNSVKKIFKTEVEETPKKIEPPQTKVKLSSGKAKGLAKKYKDIDDVGERAYQILVDLKMVGV
mmetsp:Transcript_20147/g.41515  ORF Transcript_20147/g.41515 Transcript_20147/m.41515 type:complete len:107 (+) Transcript_20147:180-500(+)